jgi:hypothetical protein
MNSVPPHDRMLIRQFADCNTCGFLARCKSLRLLSNFNPGFGKMHTKGETNPAAIAAATTGVTIVRGRRF